MEGFVYLKKMAGGTRYEDNGEKLKRCIKYDFSYINQLYRDENFEFN